MSSAWKGEQAMLLVSRVKGRLFGNDSPGHMKELTGGSAAGHFHRLSLGAEPLIEHFDGRVMPGRTEGRHIQSVSQPGLAGMPNQLPTMDALARLVRVGH